MEWHMRSLVRSVLPRHRYALAGVLAIAVLVLHAIWLYPNTYLETAIVVFVVRDSPSSLSPYSTVSESLITTSAIMAESLDSPQSEATIRAAGGSAAYSLSLINFANQDYPKYDSPFVTLTAQSTDPTATRRTFQSALNVLNRALEKRQAHVEPRGRISVLVLSQTGPLAQSRSMKRTLAATGVVAIIAMYMLSRFLDKHKVRLPTVRWREGNPFFTRRAPRHRISRTI